MYHVYMIRPIKNYELEDENIDYVFHDEKPYRRFLIESWYTEESAIHSTENLNKFNSNNDRIYYYSKE